MIDFLLNVKIISFLIIFFRADDAQYGYNLEPDQPTALVDDRLWSGHENVDWSWSSDSDQSQTWPLETDQSQSWPPQTDQSETELRPDWGWSQASNYNQGLVGNNVGQHQPEERIDVAETPAIVKNTPPPPPTSAPAPETTTLSLNPLTRLQQKLSKAVPILNQVNENIKDAISNIASPDRNSDHHHDHDHQEQHHHQHHGATEVGGYQSESSYNMEYVRTKIKSYLGLPQTLTDLDGDIIRLVLNKRMMLYILCFQVKTEIFEEQHDLHVSEGQRSFVTITI